MSAQAMRVEPAPASTRDQTKAVVLDLIRSIWFYGVFGAGILIPIVLPLYAYLSR